MWDFMEECTLWLFYHLGRVGDYGGRPASCSSLFSHLFFMQSHLLYMLYAFRIGIRVVCIRRGLLYTVLPIIWILCVLLDYQALVLILFKWAWPLGCIALETKDLWLSLCTWHVMWIVNDVYLIGRIIFSILFSVLSRIQNGHGATYH